jgi:hypothetical protein
MRELGYDLSEYKAESAFQFSNDGILFDYVITVCKESIPGPVRLERFIHHQEKVMEVVVAAAIRNLAKGKRQGKCVLMMK